MQQSRTAKVSESGGPSDAALVAQVRAGNGAAFRTIMQRHNRRLFRVARAIMGEDAEAEDVVQEAYVRGFRALANFRQEAQLATWLTRIVINEARGRLRRRRITVDVAELDKPGAMGQVLRFPGAPENMDPEHMAARSQIRRLLESAIDVLPEHYRAVFVMRDVEGMSTEETAAALALVPETVKTRLHRARAALRTALEQQLASGIEDAFPFDGVRCDRLTDAVLARLGIAD